MTGTYEQEQTQKAIGWAALDSSGILSPFHFTRRANGDNDITMKILYCGICHSDLHMTTNEFGISSYPMIPGNSTYSKWQRLVDKLVTCLVQLWDYGFKQQSSVW
ncbi:hypothetical protein HYC85_025614 [Camellia sinensis]|uniref:Alcohol dehydrogenase-like N-terminal domain-containing protein n=1 Tax=Camellia sinensis TaxID=4442 RepID=A0A7J7GFC9_CAMSI|nr:hypothetical protein HYC85_025614 [Camellia sinensis]